NVPQRAAIAPTPRFDTKPPICPAAQNKPFAQRAVDTDSAVFANAQITSTSTTTYTSFHTYRANTAPGIDRAIPAMSTARSAAAAAIASSNRRTRSIVAAALLYAPTTIAAVNATAIQTSGSARLPYADRNSDSLAGRATA